MRFVMLRLAQVLLVFDEDAVDKVWNRLGHVRASRTAPILHVYLRIISLIVSGRHRL